MATAISVAQINLSWMASTGTVDRYRIERKEGAAGTYARIDSVAGNTTTFNNTGLAPATQYFYRVQACNAGGCSAFSPEASATTLLNPPGVPGGLVATAVSTSQINLQWSAATGTVDRYRIARRTGTDQFTVVDSVSGGTLTFQNAGLVAGTQYDYQVSACNAGGCSPFSATESATTTPNAPTGLTATGGVLQINLSWTAPQGNVFQYRIERKTAVTSYEQIATVPGGTTTYQNTGLLTILYTYRVRACTASGICSQYTNEASATPIL
jgi:titin